MVEALDQTMTDKLDKESYLPLTEGEEKVLALYDRLQELRLEIAILNAQQAYRNDASASPTEEETRTAQTDLLKARAKFVLRNNVVDAVMIANPILKAVHNGTDASPIERHLLPSIESRDKSAVSVAQQAASSGRLQDESIKVQSEALRVSRNNVRLTEELFTLTEEVKRRKMGRGDDANSRQELEGLERDVRSSKRRWRVIKGVAAGVVAGSGVDWAGDDELCDIVLDPETEG